uniref:Uncharacterized protein n=1 Tax=Marseillevirus LCMAC103 TaxID=2506604 RepID=A0A481YV34_9VIRU|nr:MAG: hypothetical protein LCMAC103_04020 [Marseillevirus LCMAC103]
MKWGSAVCTLVGLLVVIINPVAYNKAKPRNTSEGWCEVQNRCVSERRDCVEFDAGGEYGERWAVRIVNSSLSENKTFSIHSGHKHSYEKAQKHLEARAIGEGKTCWHDDGDQVTWVKPPSIEVWILFLSIEIVGASLLLGGIALGCAGDRRTGDQRAAEEPKPIELV